MTHLPTWLYPVLAILAACQITETFRHGSILAPFRAWLEARGPFWDELVNCGFCFSHWAAALTVLLLIGDALCAQARFELNPCLATLWWLSIIRGANLLNDLTKRWNRSPRRDIAPLPDLELPPLDNAESTANERHVDPSEAH